MERRRRDRAGHEGRKGSPAAVGTEGYDPRVARSPFLYGMFSPWFGPRSSYFLARSPSQFVRMVLFRVLYPKVMRQPRLSPSRRVRSGVARAVLHVTEEQTRVALGYS